MPDRVSNDLSVHYSPLRDGDCGGKRGVPPFLGSQLIRVAEAGQRGNC